MVYISKMKQKLDSIRKAFEKYIDNQGYFFILYSKKVGYLWIVVAPPGVQVYSIWVRRRECWRIRPILLMLAF